MVVIAVIGLLAAMLIPAVIGIGVKNKRVQAQKQIAELVVAIKHYQSTYGQLPVSSAAQTTANVTKNDFTYGGPQLNLVLGSTSPDNSEVMAILLDLETFRNGQPTVNKGHIKNSKREVTLTVDLSSTPTGPGLGPDGVYRDPWGTPYIITFDLNYDESCKDDFYRLQLVSQNTGPTGFDGLNNRTDVNGNGNNFVRGGSVMVWSFGQDKTAATNAKAVEAPNKDNICSWK